MIRAFFYAILAVILTLMAVWLKDNPAEVTIKWFGYEISSSTWAIIIGFCLLWLIIKILSTPFNILDYLEKKRTERNLKKENKLLIEFLTATGTGDSIKYNSIGRKIDKTFADRPQLRDLMLLSISGGNTKQEVIENLSKEKNTGLLAIKSKIDLAEEENNKEETLNLYLDAFNKYPKADFIPMKLISLLALFSRWTELKSVAAQARKNGTVSKEDYRRILSSALLEEGISEGKDDLIKLAAETDDENVAAVINAARSYVKEGNKKKAFAILKKLWRTTPCYSIYETALSVTSDEEPFKRLKKIVKFLNTNKQFDLYDLLMADIHGKAQIWGQAKEYLGKYESNHASSPLLKRIKADLAAGEAPDSPNAKNLLDLSSSTQPSAPWECEQCHNTCLEWHGICPNCESFGTISAKDTETKEED